VVSALVNGVALAAIAARISEFEFTPNRVARDSVVQSVMPGKKCFILRSSVCMCRMWMHCTLAPSAPAHNPLFHLRIMLMAAGRRHHG